VSAHLLNARVVKHFVYNAPALSALPVHLLRQVYFFDFLGVCFLVSFSVRLFGVPGGPFGGHWVVLGGHLGSFGSHFGDFLEVSGISKNVCFTIVKPYFLRFRRVLVRDFFVLCFCIDTFRVFFMQFC